MNFNECNDCGAKLYTVSENSNGDKVLNCTRCNNVVREYSTTNSVQQPINKIKTSFIGKRCMKY
jgi:ribosomal protein L33